MKPKQPERAEQEGVKKLLSSIGAKFWVAGTVRKHGDHPGTMQTPGLPDMPLVFLPRRTPGVGLDYRLVVMEVKSPKAAKAKNGGLRPEQAEVKRLCEAAGVPYVHGDLNTIIAWLINEGYLRPVQLPHYRVPHD